MLPLCAPVVFCCASLLLAQKGTEPRPKADAYPVHAQAGALAIGAEYLVHSVSGEGQTYATPDYLVVEVAVFPVRGNSVRISAGDFSLVMNGKQQTLAPQAPGMVAASLKYPDWTFRRGVEATAGPVIIGRPQPTPRFPGDPTPTQNRLPRPPRAPEPADRSGIEKEPAATAGQVVTDCALPEGDFDAPVSGYVYFAYPGKTDKIKSLELVFSGPAGSTRLKLR